MAKNTTKRRKEATAAEVLVVAEFADTDWYAEAFKALGDPTRLRMVLFLHSMERAAGGLTDASVPLAEAAEKAGITVGAVAHHLTGSDQVSSNVSHHLKELRHAGLVTMKRRGKNILCRIDDRALFMLGRLLAVGVADGDIGARTK